MHKAILVLLALMALIGGASCNRRSTNEKRYPIKGKVLAVNKLDRTATISHEDIPGYMPGMTMDFKIKNDGDLELMKAGDLVTGSLVVDGLSSWIEVTSITDGGSQLTPTTIVPGEPKPGDAIPDFALLNQDGKAIRISQYKGKALALTFIYTRCPQPDQCALMSSNFAAIDRELQKLPDSYNQTHLLSITFDPDYDTPRVLRSYGASHTERYSDETFQHWEFLTGTKDEIKGMAQFFGMRYYHDTESGDEQVMHSLRTAVIDKEGKLVKLYRGNEWKPAEIVEDLKSLATQK
jgi:protein SCO1/2